MKRRITLLIDASINFILAILLLIYNPALADFLGVPATGHSFYPNILGAVLFGITIALIVEAFRKSERSVGLGLAGAVSINLCGGIVLLFWLLFGNLNLPLRGLILLWVLDIILVVVSSAELLLGFSGRNSG